MTSVAQHAEAAGRDVIVLTIRYDRALWRRAMTGWWQSVVPPAPFVQRAIFWAVIWAAIGVLTMVLYALGIAPGYVAAGLIGAGFLIGVFGYLQRTRMGRFWDVIGAHWDRAGETEAVFGPEGVTLSDDVSRKEMSWAAIDAVKGARGVTVIRSGISMIAVPDAALPEGLTPGAFRDRLRAWRAA
ncbi:MAG: hypothetical protein LJE62_11685 [Silicimonas sp.]|nr:hypothetical protein [Silicimonas sp.]